MNLHTDFCKYASIVEANIQCSNVIWGATWAENSTTWICSTEMFFLLLQLFHFTVEIILIRLAIMVSTPQLLEQLKQWQQQQQNLHFTTAFGMKEPQRAYSLSMFSKFKSSEFFFSVEFHRIGNKNRMKSWWRGKFNDSLEWIVVLRIGKISKFLVFQQRLRDFISQQLTAVKKKISFWRRKNSFSNFETRKENKNAERKKNTYTNTQWN